MGDLVLTHEIDQQACERNDAADCAKGQRRRPHGPGKLRAYERDRKHQQDEYRQPDGAVNEPHVAPNDRVGPGRCDIGTDCLGQLPFIFGHLLRQAVTGEEKPDQAADPGQKKQHREPVLLQTVSRAQGHGNHGADERPYAEKAPHPQEPFRLFFGGAGFALVEQIGPIPRVEAGPDTGQPEHDPAQENGCIFPARREISRIGAVDQSANHVLAGIGKKQERASHRQQNEHDSQIGKGNQNIPYPLASLAAPPRHPHKQAAVNPGHRRRPPINLRLNYITNTLRQKRAVTHSLSKTGTQDGAASIARQ